MQDPGPTRRTAFKVLALLGVGATGSTGAAAAFDDNDDVQVGQQDGGLPDHTDLFVAHLRPHGDVESNARGVAMVQRRRDALQFVVLVANIENVTMSHIHEDEVLGPIAVWLYDFETQSERLQEGTFSGILDSGTITDDIIQEGKVPDAASDTVDELLEKIRAGEAYVNVHTEEYPGGAIAGRLVRFSPRALLGRSGGSGRGSY